MITLETSLILLIVIVFFIVLYIYMNNCSMENFENNWCSKIDGIIYINLEKRADRNKLVLNELNYMNTNMDKVHKVSGINIPLNGHKGCVQSHLLALNIATMNKWNVTLIFEDDMQLNVSPSEFNKMVSDALDYLKDNKISWDVILLATVRSKKENIKSIDNNILMKVKNSTTSSGYIVNNSYYNKLMEVFNKSNSMMSKDKWSVSKYSEPWALDQKWLPLQAKDNWFAFKKDLIKQRHISSSIMLT